MTAPYNGSSRPTAALMRAAGIALLFPAMLLALFTGCSSAADDRSYVIVLGTVVSGCDFEIDYSTDGIVKDDLRIIAPKGRGVGTEGTAKCWFDGVSPGETDVSIYRTSFYSGKVLITSFTLSVDEALNVTRVPE